MGRNKVVGIISNSGEYLKIVILASVITAFIAGIIFIVINILKSRKIALCPYCNAELRITDSHMSHGCPQCSKYFIIRRAKVYREEEVCSELVYYMVVIFADIAKRNPQMVQEYENFIELYIRKQEFNKQQYEDAHKVYNKELLKRLGRDYEKAIRQLNKFLTASYEGSTLQEQEKMENEIFSLLYSFATLAVMKEGQEKVLKYLMKTFNISERTFKLRGM